MKKKFNQTQRTRKQRQQQHFKKKHRRENNETKTKPYNHFQLSDTTQIEQLHVGEAGTRFE
jgi:hypothetical protein